MTRFTLKTQFAGHAYPRRRRRHQGRQQGVRRQRRGQLPGADDRPRAQERPATRGDVRHQKQR